LPRIRTYYDGLGVNSIGLTTGERDVLNVKVKLKSIFVSIIGHDSPEGSRSITLLLL
jgi:hypothetical protein